MINDTISTTQTIGINIKKNNCLVSINQTKSEYKKTYTLGARFCMRLVSIVLPGILRLNLERD